MSAVTKAAPVAYVVFGSPGCGKSIFADAIKAFGYEHLSTGDITRQEVEMGTEFGIKYKEVILDPNHGGLIPSKDIEQLLMQKIENALKNQKGIIFDGYPKTVEQYQFLDNFFAEKGLKDRVAIVMLDVKEEIAIERAFSRQRSDFTLEGTKERINKFKPKMESILNYYGNRLHHIDVNGPIEDCQAAYTKLHNSFTKA